MQRTLWWYVLGLFSVGIMVIDITTGPYIQFPIILVIPVGLAAWYINRGAAIFFALVLVGCRLGIEVRLEPQVIPTWATLVNESIQLVVLIGVSLVIAAVQEKRFLTKRLRALEGFLPICMFCKKIRGSNGAWEEVEAYVSRYSTAQFTHGCCEICGAKEYGEYFSSPNDAK